MVMAVVVVVVICWNEAPRRPYILGFRTHLIHLIVLAVCVLVRSGGPEGCNRKQPGLRIQVRMTGVYPVSRR
jgi:hypothetical protein